MTTTVQETAVSYAYRAHGPDGATISGMIDAPDIDQAQRRLESLQLRVLEISQAQRPDKPGALRSEDFIAFNEQLGHLTAAGLPLEHGLRLIAEDMRSGKLSATVRQIAAELEAGRPLAEAFQRQRGNFPSSYGSVLEAGVRSGNLSGVLFSLARHLELVRRLRGLLWRAVSYPLMVLVGLGLVMLFLSWAVFPQFQAVLAGMRLRPSDLTRLLLGIWPVVPVVVYVGLAVLALLAPAAWILRKTGRDGWALDTLVLRVPLIGSAMRKSILASWCDAARLGLEAGLDLPAAAGLAADASPSPALRQDSRELIAWLSRGAPPESCPRGRVLPATITAAMGLGMHQDLAGTLRSLSEMYHQQAEGRIQAIPAILTPLLTIALGVIVALIVMSLMMPLVELLRAVSGGGKW